MVLLPRMSELLTIKRQPKQVLLGGLASGQNQVCTSLNLPVEGIPQSDDCRSNIGSQLVMAHHRRQDVKAI